MDAIVRQKINDDIFKRSMKDNFQLLPNMGYSKHEFEYKLCKSSDKQFNNFYFIVSRILEYKNSSLINNSKKTYIYDINGNYVDDIYLLNKCKGGFYKKLEIID